MYFTLNHPLTRFLLLGIAGIFYTLSFAPYDIKFLAYFSLLIFIFILLGADKKSSIKLSFFYGFIIFLSGVYWLVPSNSHGNPPNIYDLIISTNTHADEIISGKYLLVSLSLLFTINPNGTKVRDNVKINRKVKRVETK